MKCRWCKDTGWYYPLMRQREPCCECGVACLFPDCDKIATVDSLCESCDEYAAGAIRSAKLGVL